MTNPLSAAIFDAFGQALRHTHPQLMAAD
jgi:hypothetical protein